MNKIKKILISILILTCLCGCINVKTSNYDTIANNIIKNKRKLYNTYTEGFKYYLPRYMSVVKKDDYNQIVRDGTYKYYLYADLIAYYNKVKVDYKEDNSLFYSQIIDDALINIMNENDNYIICINYNYAIIEVSVKKNDIKEALSNALIIVSSIKYNDDAIKIMIDNENAIEDAEVIDIFDKDKTESNYLEYDDTYTGDETKDYDPDVIN